MEYSKLSVEKLKSLFKKALERNDLKAIYEIGYELGSRGLSEWVSLTRMDYEFVHNRDDFYRSL